MAFLSNISFDMDIKNLKSRCLGVFWSSSKNFDTWVKPLIEILCLHVEFSVSRDLFSRTNVTPGRKKFSRPGTNSRKGKTENVHREGEGVKPLNKGHMEQLQVEIYLELSINDGRQLLTQTQNPSGRYLL